MARFKILGQRRPITNLSTPQNRPILVFTTRNVGPYLRLRSRKSLKITVLLEWL